jgi:hypothetical protein
MSQQPQQVTMPPWVTTALKRAVSPGTLIGAAAAGGLLFMASHRFTTALGTSIATFVVMGGLRAADNVLAPVWRAVAKIPWQARYVGGVALPILYAKTQFGESASGQEISRARMSMLVSAVIAYILMRPRRGTGSAAP